MTQSESIPIKVCIVEDNDDLRESLAALINGTPGFRFLNAYSRAQPALKHIPEDAPDVVLMDIKMPKMNGIECVRLLRQLMPSIKVLMLTTYEDEDLLFQSLRAGASGYLLKRTPPVKILEALEEIHSGASPLTGKMARILVKHFQMLDPSSEEFPSISVRESEILEALAKGLRNKEIATELHVSENTVRTHLRNIYEKLQVESRTEAIAKYLKHQPNSND